MSEVRLVPLVLLAMAVAASGCREGGRKPQDPVQRGLEACRKGDYDTAIKAYREATEKNPKDYNAYNLLGMALRFKYNRTGDPKLKQQEIDAFSRAVELEPRFVVALVNLGASYYFSGKKKKAAEVFKRVLEISPNHPEAAKLKEMIAEAEQDPRNGSPDARKKVEENAAGASPGGGS